MMRLLSASGFHLDTSIYLLFSNRRLHGTILRSFPRPLALFHTGLVLDLTLL